MAPQRQNNGKRRWITVVECVVTTRHVIIKGHNMRSALSVVNDWYSLSSHRIVEWDLNGLSLNEAETYLIEYLSEFPAAGIEVGKYIAENWTSRRVKMLDPKARQILIQICNDYELTIK